MTGIPTPTSLPAQWDVVRLLVPHEQSWYAIFLGALEGIMRADTYKAYSGVSEACAASVFEPLFRQALDESEGFMFPGMLVPAGRATAPDNWLPCDGAAYLIVQYPALYNAIGDAFGNDGDGTFRVPDMRGRVAVGVGQGSGLTDRVLAATGGEETHVLSVAEMPSHSHQVSPPHVIGAAQSGTGQAVWTNSPPAFVGTNSQGSGTAHNTMQPFVVLNWFIFAGWSCA